MAECLELFDTTAGLLVRIVSCANGAHARGLVAGVALGRVVKVGVRPAGAVDADVAGHRDVGAAMRLAHDRNHRNLRARIQQVATTGVKAEGSDARRKRCGWAARGASGGDRACARRGWQR
jgi:hypothetical protein